MEHSGSSEPFRLRIIGEDSIRHEMTDGVTREQAQAVLEFAERTLVTS